jgi:hypothetical protein
MVPTDPSVGLPVPWELVGGRLRAWTPRAEEGGAAFFSPGGPGPQPTTDELPGDRQSYAGVGGDHVLGQLIESAQGDLAQGSPSNAGKGNDGTTTLPAESPCLEPRRGAQN